MNRDTVNATGSSAAADGERPLVGAAWAQFQAIMAGAQPRPIQGSHAVTFPGYRLLGEIHRGGQGVVYQALQESTRRKVAIKVPKEGPFADRSELARFDREVEVLSRLNHPHIVSIHDRGLTAGHAFYVMDYIAGQSLDAYVAGADLSIEEILRLFVKVCDAVNAAHLRGVIHRDLKPANIRIDEEGQPRILDFGLAKLAQEAASSAQGMTLTGQFVGSLPWASPEQVGGTGEQVSSRRGASPAAPFTCSPVLLDIRTDVYSLGVILYQILTGRFPYPVTGRIDDVVRHIIQTSPARPSTTRRVLDRDLELILLKCLAKEPERRYQSAGELAGDFRHVLAHEPVTATSPSAAYRLRKFAQRNRGAVIAGAVVASALLVATGVSVTIGLREARQRGVAESARQRAQLAENEAKVRANELEQVAKFQEAQLSGIDAQSMGVRLRGDLLMKARDAAKRSKLPPNEIEARARELENLIAGSDFTNLALETLNSNVFQRALAAVESQFVTQPLVKARLLQTIAMTLNDLGLIENAVAPQTEALDIRRRELGEENSETLEAISNMAVLLLARGKLNDAEPLCREALEKSRRLRGDQASQTLIAITNMGTLLKDQGKLAESEPYCREALATLLRVRGADDPETLSATNDLAMLLKARGKLNEAEPLLRDTLDKRRRVLGNDDPKTLISISNMGVLMQNRGRLVEAEPLFREALERNRRVLGGDHPLTIRAIHDVGMILQLQGKLAETEPFYREALEKRRRITGEQHSDTLSTINNLGLLLKSAGRLEEADVLYREALAKRRRYLGEDHPDTLNSLNNLGALMWAQGKPDEAAVYFQDVLEKQRRSLGDEHPQTLTTMNNLGNILIVLGRLPESETYMRECMNIRRRVLGSEHPDTLATMSNMGMLLWMEHRLAEAETLCREALEKQRQILGDNHANTLASIGNLGGLLQAQSKSEEAFALLAPAEPAARKASTGGNAIRLARFLTPLGRARADLRQFDAAEKNLLEAQAIIMDAKSASLRDRTEVSHGLVQLYEAWHAAEPEKGHDAEAARWREKMREFQSSPQSAKANQGGS